MQIYNLPVHKRISTYIVDFFKETVQGATHYFLSHFHADHYHGLNSKFPEEIYCSPTTAALIKLKFKIKTVALEMFKEYELANGDTVKCIEAYHCPGAVCFIFKLKSQGYVLHTGDFRSTPEFLDSIRQYSFNTVYLDNTYEGFKSFGTQKEAIHRILRVMEDKYKLPVVVPLRICFLFCTYFVGKEKIFLSAAEYFKKKVKVTKEKKKVLDAFDEYSKKRLMEEIKTERDLLTKRDLSTERDLSSLLTVDDHSEFMVISTQHCNKDSLNKLLLGNPADHVVVFCGTGWKDCVNKIDWKKANGRIIKKGIEIHYIPYSEHSSSGELKSFLETIKTKRIINTVKYKH
ncbi:DNA cross-link repair 1A protein [Nosema granulosis]|uniref:DNA cross-link repair 1A protein n=1 Tax=Nosema granulosis TaxID=83296 RepID=A0A9P6KZG9_9MICR|nr:DNA cross-link repair 1A protein [Nosema granulosis]